MDETCTAKWILEEDNFSLSFANLANVINPTPESQSPTDPTFEFPPHIQFSTHLHSLNSPHQTHAGQSNPKFPTNLSVYNSQLHLNQQTQVTSKKKFVALSKSSGSNTSKRSSRSGSGNSRRNSAGRKSSMLSRRLSVQLFGPGRVQAGNILAVGSASRRVWDDGGSNGTKEEKANKEGKWVKKLVDSLAMRCLRCHALESK